MTTSQRNQLLSYISHCLDDCLNVHPLKDMPPDARLVVYQCGFEPLVVAVWSYLPNTKIGADEAEEIAEDYLREIGWLQNDLKAEYVV